LEKIRTIMKYIVIIILVLTGTGYGCRKELRGGCKIKTDTINHDPTADYEDGSCIFISEVNFLPDSIDKYPVNIYIDNIFKSRLTKISVSDVGFRRGYVEKFPSNEIHLYRVEDDFGKVWEDTFSTPNQFKGERTILIRR
jgi:hypothetical protein